MDNTEEYTCLSLCSGYGGLELGLKRACPNVRTVAYVEIEAFACANLVTKMEAGLLDAAPVWTDIKTFDAEPFRDRIHIITAGFPCQPFSVAGKRGGSTDERHLWPHIERIIEAVRPVFVFLENVPGLLSARSLDNRPDLCRYLTKMGKATEKMPARERWYLGEHLRRLEQYWLRTEGIPAYAAIYFSLRLMGYSVEAGLFTAAEVGAPHRRERLFILANNENGGFTGSNLSIRQSQRQKQTPINSMRVSKMADADGRRTPRKSQKFQKRKSGIGGNSKLANTGGTKLQGRQSKPGNNEEECQAVTGSCCKWPARPGRPQYEWEEPRVVADSGCGRCKQSTKKLQARRNTAQQTDQREAQSRLGRTITRRSCGMDKCICLKGQIDVWNKIRPCKELCLLWQDNEAKEIQQTIRRLWGISTPKVLQQALLQIEQNAIESKQVNKKKSSETDRKNNLRKMPNKGKAPTSSPRYCQLRQCGNSLPEMPRTLAYCKWKLGRNETSVRIDRLRLLGNGVVPQQAEKAFRYLMAKFEANR